MLHELFGQASIVWLERIADLTGVARNCIDVDFRDIVAPSSNLFFQKRIKAQKENPARTGGLPSPLNCNEGFTSSCRPINYRRLLIPYEIQHTSLRVQQPCEHEIVISIVHRIRRDDIELRQEHFMQDFLSLGLGEPRLPSPDIHIHDSSYLGCRVPQVCFTQSNIARSLGGVINKTKFMCPQGRKPNRMSNLAPTAKLP